MYREIKENELRIDSSLKYAYFLDKNHPLATGNSYRVYYHRHIMSMKLGRWVTSEEVVHHKDENRSNNSIDNLELTTNSEHARLHQTILVDITCQCCNTMFKPKDSDQIYCSQKCASLARQKKSHNSFDKSLLEKQIWELGFTQTGKIYGYSDTGIKKLAKKLNCALPPPYFHNKIRSSEERLNSYYSDVAQR